VDGEPRTDFVWPVSRLFQSLPPALSIASDYVYRNDETPVPTKLKNAISAFRRSLSLPDHLFPVGCGLALLVLMPIQWICELIHLVITRPSPEQFLSSFF